MKIYQRILWALFLFFPLASGQILAQENSTTKKEGYQLTEQGK